MSFCSCSQPIRLSEAASICESAYFSHEGELIRSGSMINIECV